MNRSYNRSFGLMISIILTLLCTIYYSKLSYHSMIILLSLAIIFIAISIICPNILNWPSNKWLQFSLCINKITNPLVLGAIFFLIITPISIILRIFNKDPLRLKTKDKSYWTVRNVSYPNKESMENPF